MFQGLRRHLRSVSHLIGKCSLFPVLMDYGLYPPPDRYTADQVPYQNMHVTHTIDLIGATRVHIKKQLGDAKQRFCTLQVTGRAVSPQNMPFSCSSSEHVAKLLLYLQKQVFSLPSSFQSTYPFLADGSGSLRSYQS